MKNLSVLPVLILLFLSGGCRLLPAAAPPPATPTSLAAAAPAISSPSPSSIGTVALSTPEAVAPTAEPAVGAPTLEARATETTLLPPAWPAAVVLADRFDGTALTGDEVAAAAALLNNQPPTRDDLLLAQEYQGVTELPPALSASEPLQVGTISPFTVLNIDENSNQPIEAALLAVSDHAYFWFDTSTRQPTAAELATVTTAFDQIYEVDVAAFGQELTPGVDGDVRLHIVHAAPSALCSDANLCGLAGYFSGRDALPLEVNEFSNERDMFVMNADNFGTTFYLDVLAHEFRHMIEDAYDQSDADWEIEGSAMLAEDLNDFPLDPIDRGNAFLAQPDQQLNRWTDGSTYSYYGMGYVLNRYIYDRLGPDLYREFAQHPADGLDAVTAVAEAHGLDLTGQSLWEEWLVTLAVHDRPEAPEPYQIGNDGLQAASQQPVATYPAAFEDTVHQYGVDYYRLTGNDPVTLSFEGSRRVPLLDIAPVSGSHFWYANRANYSHLQLARSIDLRNVVTATLYYSVYHDIEYGYDYAYLSVSTDGGQTWQGLEGAEMQGLLAADDPSASALTDRFYTGQSIGWAAEEVDLTAYAGQEIRLRFSYVTDPILTFGGLALDNISIPAIGFYDSVESPDAGWTAKGFTRVTATLPQQWHLQLITFPGGVPTVTPLPVAEDGTISTTVELGASDGEAILAVAASAPLTLEQAEYRLRFE